MLWRRLAERDPWIADADAFDAAVERVSDEVIDGLLTVPFDGSLAADRALARFTSDWIRHLQASVEVHREPAFRSGHVSLNRTAWHEVAVLKFLHERFILDRADLAVYQRGQASLIERLVDGLTAWLEDPHDVRRAPNRLLDLVDLATEDYFTVRAERPELLSTTDQAELQRRAVGRGVIDYISSLTDSQAIHVDALLTGQTERLWDAGQAL
jgi:dGTPase